MMATVGGRNIVAERLLEPVGYPYPSSRERGWRQRGGEGSKNRKDSI